MKDEILSHLKEQLSKEEYEKIKDRNFHLGVFSEPCLSYMLEGKKTIESRFSKNKNAPYHKIDKEDVVIVKKSSKGVVAYFTIKKILFFDLKEVSIAEIRNKYQTELCVNEKFWLQKKDSCYATLLFIDHLVKVKEFKITKKGMQTWLTLDK